MGERKPHILVVDDDDRLRSLLKKFLSEQEFMVTTAADGGEARRKLKWFLFDLVVLDVMMPGESGFELLKFLHKDSNMPTLMLSAMGDAGDRIRGLEIGAEDYLTKPFEPRELVLRIKTILRRAAAARPASIAFGEYRFDLATGQLKRGETGVDLTSNEAVILRRLAERRGHTVSRDDLSKLLPGSGSERAVDVQITRLRKKIEESEGKPVYLQTVRGAGYVLYAD